MSEGIEKEQLFENLDEEKAEQVSEAEQSVDESVKIIREVASMEQPEEAQHFSAEDMKKGDGIFRLILIGGLIVAGLVLILMATFAEEGEKTGLFIGGVLFAGFGLVLDFLSRHIKKD